MSLPPFATRDAQQGGAPNPSPFATPLRVLTNVRPVPIGGGKPGGAVEVYEGSTLLATATLNDTFGNAYPPNLPLGTHTLHTVYGGDNEFLGSTSPPFEQIITPETALIQVAAMPAAARSGDEVRLVATLLGGHPGMPTGTVTLKNEEVVLGTKTLDPGGMAFVTTTALQAGASPPSPAPPPRAKSSSSTGRPRSDVPP